MTGNLSLKHILTEPQSIEELHIPQGIVIDLIFRLLFNEGNVAVSRFIEVLKISSRIIDDTMLWLQKEHHVEVSKADSGLGRLGYVYSLTDSGKARARDAFDRSQYVGPVPVPIAHYSQAVELQTKQHRKVTSEQVIQAIKHLILPADFHRRIGPSINSGSSLFLHGPPGNGKTTIAQAIAGLVSGSDPIWIPYSVTAGGYIIQIHDRLIHTVIPIEGGRVQDIGRIDQRWGYFKRPSVTVGGELKMEALELRFDPVSKFYEAPLQMKANGGMFLLDDFGRQQVSPRDLLNRWIVPLESEIDFLRLHNGQTLVVPFRSLIVFSTNLDPNELVDDAFLRRIQMKVAVESPDDKLFYQIFLMVCKQYDVTFDKEVFIHLIQNWYQKQGRTYQAVHPRDLIRTIVSLCEYDNSSVHLTKALIDEACRAYFVN